MAQFMREGKDCRLNVITGTKSLCTNLNTGIKESLLTFFTLTVQVVSVTQLSHLAGIKEKLGYVCSSYGEILQKRIITNVEENSPQICEINGSIDIHLELNVSSSGCLII